MKKLLVILIILICFSCNKDLPKIVSVLPNNPISKQDTIVIQNPTQPKVGFVIDSVWLKNTYPGYWIEANNGFGEGDFNNDGFKDLVIMFATNTSANILHQKDISSKIVIGVFINHKTYFVLDTNLVYSYLGGFAGVNVADINHDGYLDIYQMTGYWEGSTYPKPSYYNNSGHGGMDSYVFINNKNKGFIKYIIPIEDNSGSTLSIIYDNNKNGFDEIYTSSCLCYYEFNGNFFIKNNLSLDKTFMGQSYNMNVLTPKYADKNVGVIFTGESIFGNAYFVLKIEQNKLIPKTMFKPTHLNSGPAQQIYVEDLDKDGKFEYIIPMLVSGNNNNTIPHIPYIMIIDENGNNVSKKLMDDEITSPLTYEQIDWIESWQTGFIYYTFADIDNDGIKEIFPANGVGYKKGNDTYYYKFIEGKYRLQFYHSNWFGSVHKNNKLYINYKPFVDEKNIVNVFLPLENNLYNTIFKSF
jgi:hypothetical protein